MARNTSFAWSNNDLGLFLKKFGWKVEQFGIPNAGHKLRYGNKCVTKKFSKKQLSLFTTKEKKKRCQTITAAINGTGF